MSSRFRQLWNRLRKKSYREAFVSAHLADNIAAQILAQREARGWTQSQLAAEAGMAQARISVMEASSYDKTSLTTLKRLAAAFDVALIVRFVTYGELLEWVVSMTPEKLCPPKFDDEYRGMPASVTTSGDSVVKMKGYITDDDFSAPPVRVPPPIPDVGHRWHLTIN